MLSVCLDAWVASITAPAHKDL